MAGITGDMAQLGLRSLLAQRRLSRVADAALSWLEAQGAEYLYEILTVFDELAKHVNLKALEKTRLRQLLDEAVSVAPAALVASPAEQADDRAVKSEYSHRGEEQDTPVAEQASQAEEQVDDDPARCEVACGESPEGDDKAQYGGEQIDMVEGVDSEPEEDDEGVHELEEAVGVVPEKLPLAFEYFVRTYNALGSHRSPKNFV